MRLFALIFCLLFFASGFAQIEFFKLYTGDGDDFGHGVVQLEDSSYVITGASSSFVNGASQAFLLKTDSTGNFLWSMHYGGPESESGQRVLYKKNVGFFVAGFTNSIGNGAYDFYLFKTDEQGVLEWQKSYGGSGWDKVNDAALTSDTGVLLVGENSSNPTNNKDIYIVRTDIFGDTLWTKTIGGGGNDFATSVAKYNDSVFVIGGTIFNQDSLVNKGFIMGVHDNGTTLWVDSIGNNGNYQINDLCINNDFLYGVGSAVSSGSNNSSQYHFRRSLIDGSMIENVLGGQGDYYAEIILYDTIIDRVKIGYTYLDQSSVDNSLDFALRMYHPDLNNIPGNLLSLPYPGIDRGNEIIQTSDGGILVVGRTESQYTSYHHVFVAKMFGYLSATVPHDEVDIVAVHNIDNLDGFILYPNPSSGVVFIEGAGSNPTIEIYDQTGRKMKFEASELNGSRYSFDPQFEDGLYTVVISSDGAHHSFLLRFVSN